jgi:uncharacterized protein (TIGR02453 family)
MSGQTTFAGFPIKGLQFLRDLSANNNRDWFKAHEQSYREDILEPGRLFVIALGERLKTISKGISYDPQTNGTGSIMRIYRDLRFSKDKTPYNTNLRIIFWEGPLKKTENPGIYFSMDANEAVIYSGLYMFSKDQLDAFRQAVLDRGLGSELEQALADVKAAGDYKTGGATYKRVPAGYPIEHARAQYLLYTGLYGQSPIIKPEVLTQPTLVDVCFAHCKNMAPIHHWLVEMIKISA